MSYVIFEKVTVTGVQTLLDGTTVNMGNSAVSATGIMPGTKWYLSRHQVARACEKLNTSAPAGKSYIPGYTATGLKKGAKPCD